MSVATKLSVKDIQLAIRNSPWCDLRSDIIVPNVSWGLLPYEADLIQVKKSNLVVEYEIKRSFEDFKKDFTKYHTHDAQLIAYFYYVIPEKLIEKVRTFLINHFGSSENSPAVLYYDENSGIHTMTDENHKEFGNPKRKTYIKISESEKATLGRLVSIRYWNTQNEICKGGFSKKDRKIRELNESLKYCNKKLKELARREGSDKWIKTSVTVPDDGRLVLAKYYGGIELAYFDHKENKWIKKDDTPLNRWVHQWVEIPAYEVTDSIHFTLDDYFVSKEKEILSDSFSVSEISCIFATESIHLTIMKCIINIFEFKNKIENINAGELKKYTKEQLNEKDEILVKSFKLNVVNFNLGDVYNHKERAYDPDCYVRSVRFEIERSDEFRDYVNSIVTDDEVEREINPHELDYYFRHHFCDDPMGFAYEVNEHSSGKGTYKLTETKNYKVTLLIV